MFYHFHSKLEYQIENSELFLHSCIYILQKNSADSVCTSFAHDCNLFQAADRISGEETLPEQLWEFLTLLLVSSVCT